MQHTTDRQSGRRPLGPGIAQRTTCPWTRLGLLSLVFAASLLAFGARAATPAGASITNIANLTYRSGGSDYGAASNRVNVTVGEIIDFSVTAVGNLGVAPGALHQGVAFRLTNLGNARRAFGLALDPAQVGDSFDPTACQIYVDRSDAAMPDMASVEPFGRGASLLLAANETVTVWAVCDIPADAGGTGRSP